MRINKKQNKHSIIILLLICNLILQGCNLGTTGNTKNSTSESVENYTSSSSTTIEATQEIVQETIEKTTIPTDPNEQTSNIFEHNGVLLNLPLRQEMPDDTSTNKVVEPQFANSWELEEDPVRKEILKHIYETLINPQPLLDENGEAVKFTEEDSEFYYGMYDSYVDRYQFVVDLSAWSLEIGTDEMGSLVSEILFTEPRFFAYDWKYLFNHNSYDFNDAKFTIFPTEQYNSVNPIEVIELDYQEVLLEVKEIASKIMAVTDNQWQRIRLAHDYLAEYLDYDPTPPEDHLHNNVYMALLGPDKFTKCLGYAQANALVLASMGIEVIPVTGHILEGYHEWNYVKIEDAWYVVDVTFDGTDGKDPDRVVAKSGSINYFLKGSEFVNDTHTPILQVAISEMDYMEIYEQEGRYFDNTEDFVADLTAYLDDADLYDDIAEVYEFAYNFDVEGIEAMVNEALNAGKNSGIEIVIDWQFYQNVCRIFVGAQSL